MKSRKQIPLDVIFDIFTSLPVKSLVRFRCISKSCSSIITSQDFAKMHATRYSSIKSNFQLTPTIIISCSTELQSAQMFFSSELHEGSGSASAVHLRTIPPRFSRYTTHSVNGIICMDFGLCATIFNPSNRQAVTLPFVCPPNSPAAASTSFCVNSFGFDPITECYKVLNSWAVSGKATEYRVFTLGTNNSWRLLGDGPSYFPKRESVCIDGIIYFKCHYSSVLFAFHVHTEKFNEIPLPEGIFNWRSDLIQFAGRLGLVDTQFDLQSNSINIWLLEDHLMEEWVGHSIVFPTFWKEIEGYQNFLAVGTIHTGEILLAPRTLLKQFCVYIYDVERRRLRRIELSGLPEYRPLDFSSNAVTVTNYEQNILSLQ
ncbi:hypothetical protein CRYUN_Cryun13aG0047100 [Craigia yunnanensis]